MVITSGASAKEMVAIVSVLISVSLMPLQREIVSHFLELMIPLIVLVEQSSFPPLI